MEEAGPVPDLPSHCVLSAVRNLEGEEGSKGLILLTSGFVTSDRLRKMTFRAERQGRGTQLQALRQQKPAASLLTFGVPRRGEDKGHPPW